MLINHSPIQQFTQQLSHFPLSENYPMTTPELLATYNYDSFTPEKVLRWLNFAASPPLGEPAPDFPLWDLDGRPTSLREIWSQHLLTVVEFGSFT